MQKNWNTYHDVKICCYAIAANEPEEFIDRWLASMSGADYITVLITKENDANYDYFKKYAEHPQFKGKLFIKQKTIAPWRFDTARNESMKLIPSDTDVCICTDIDEILIESFWDDLRKVVFEHPDYERVFYQYAWSHDNETGEPKWYFWYDKIHQPKGWKWEYPVHEALTCPDKQELGYYGQYKLDSNKIYLHHYPDQTKSRGSYLKLLELRAKEYPDDLYGLYYLAREYTFYNNYENALKTSLQLYTNLLKDGIQDDMLMLPSISCFIADMFNNLNLKKEAEFFYKRALDFDETFRDAYIKLAQLYAYQPNKFNECYATIEEMERKSKFIADWRINSIMWRPWKKFQILADAACWEGRYQKAKELIEKGLEDIKTEDDKKDAINENFYNDLEFINNKFYI